MATLDSRAHLDYAATRDESTALVVRNGKIALIAESKVIGRDAFNRFVDALNNQQSFESLELILETA